MSFFGFDTSLPRDRHQQTAPGFSAHDAFEGLSGRDGGENEVLDFEDTYAGFGGELDDRADEDNADTFGTFGDEPLTQTNVKPDFDFSGRTGNVAQAFEEERMRYTAQHAPGRLSPAKKTAKPKRTGYEYIPQLEVDADLWGIAPKKEPESEQAPAPAPAGRKAMTLEEVEAMMLSQSRPPAQGPPQGYPSAQPPFHDPAIQAMGPIDFHQTYQQHPGQPQFASQQYPQHPQILQRPAEYQHQQHQPQPQPQAQYGNIPQQPPQAIDNHGQQRVPQILQRQRPVSQEQPVAPHQAQRGPKQHHRQQQAQQQGGFPPQGPRQILQNPNRLAGQGQPIAHHQQQSFSQRGGHNRGPSYGGPIITNPQQILNLSEDERAAYLQEEARRAKRNHKIHLLSKHNGLMTPQDKNFITRIQLQQLVTATGNVDADGPESLLNEDFYYQVYAQIRGGTRQNPHQPANQFAQTYLFQTGGRYGHGRRQVRGGDNHMQRMEQQVQRAVEAARAKPKNKQLVIEGSLGKISFSNAKTPKPLLNIRRQTEETSAKRPTRHHDPTEERRATLKNIEAVFNALMEIEDHARLRPLDESNMFSIWLEKTQQLNEKLWGLLKAYEPIVDNHAYLHPFIAILSHSKGKKLVPRAFRHLTTEQQTILLTVTLVHLDTLDVVHNALALPVSAGVKEEIELFANAVSPVLFSHLNEQPLVVIAGLLGLIISRCNLRAIIRTKIGITILTMLISRAEMLRESQQADGQQWQQYTKTYTDFFNFLESMLPQIFPDQNPLATDDVYVWQFLAAMGVAANAEQQQRLVLGVKDRVMSAVTAARTLPTGEQERRLGEVNLFMRALGLDVELLA